MHLADEAIEWHFRQATDLMEDSELRIRGRRVAPKVKDQTVILVNDNQNNDSRMTVAREALLRLGAAQVIVAAPIVNSSGAPLPHSIALYSHEKPLTPEQIYEHSIAVLENQERHLILEANASTAVA
jgi:hypothetical protein